MNDVEKYKGIKKYWDNRAQKHGRSAQATTNDYYMREIEIRCLTNAISEFSKRKEKFTVADIGCGNGYSTIKLAKKYPEAQFNGFDYSENMISFAKEIQDQEVIPNVAFHVLDITKDPIPEKYDFVFTDRCLINLPSYALQISAIESIYNALNDNGTFVLIENFIDGHNSFNKLRKEFGLKEINIREHNFFFDKNKLEPFLDSLFKSIEFINISSQYYIGSRIIYSKICAGEKIEPDYFDVHHKIASKLPFIGNFGPIGMYSLRGKCNESGE
ncbi:MAG: class I SAM-dependent methyltransferase [Desulfobulbaceae bacterium]|nr:class I SAM-dependent methyltransferase [Desulfobulbaceae bacterium]